MLLALREQPMLKNWSPETLKQLYANSVDESISEVIFRLGSDLEMESVWSLLLQTHPKVIEFVNEKPHDQYSEQTAKKLEKARNKEFEIALVGSINGIVRKVFNNPNAQLPSEIKKSHDKQLVLIEKLLPLMDDYSIGNYLKSMGANLQEQTTQTLAQWHEKPTEERLGHWLNTAAALTAKDALNAYKQHLNAYYKQYKSNYWSAQKAQTIREVKTLLRDIYSENLTDQAAIIISAILDEPLDKTDI
jgi:hypothetical protein